MVARGPGRYLDGESAVERAVVLEIAESTLEIRSDDGSILARWPVGRVRIDSTSEAGDVHLEHLDAPDALAITADAHVLEALRRSGSDVRELPRGRSRIVWGVVCLSLVVALLGGFYLASPVIATQLSHRISPERERFLTGDVAALVADHACRDADADRVLAELKARLDPEATIPAEIYVVDMALPNAFALPGGVVVVSSGLIAQAESADEVAGVLAHELAHVQHRHVLSHLIRNAMLGALWTVTLGDYSGFLVVDPDTAYQLATLKHSREAELEADATAVHILTRAKISPRGLAAFFERLENEVEDHLTWISTHPSSRERNARLKVAPIPAGASPALSEAALSTLRAACRNARPTTLQRLFE